MSLGFTYMGTKRQIAGHVADVIAQAPPGPLLDAFAGMSAVGTAVGPLRPIWCNDVQNFAYTVSKALFTAHGRPLVSPAALQLCQEGFEQNRARLCRDLGDALEREEEVYASRAVIRIRQLNHELISNNMSVEAERKRRLYRPNPKKFPYQLFSTAYAGGYIGLAQAIDIDSLRFAIDQLTADKAINSDTHRWMLLALCRALGRASNSTGHFAQYLSVKQSTKLRFLAKRRRSIWREWQAAMDEMYPLGCREWRRSNRALQGEAVDLLRRLSRVKNQPSVIYCDPPYTNDHYSRYYHLVETLLLYDYPPVEAKGLYRPDRFSSPFSIRTKVHWAFEGLIDAAARLNSTLVLSYPDNGLLKNPRATLVRLLRERFEKVDIAAEMVHEHSTLGASKGPGKSSVTELVFVAHH